MKNEIKQLIDSRNAIEKARRQVERATQAFRENARRFAEEAISLDTMHENHVAVVNGVAYCISIHPDYSEYDDLANAVEISVAINHGDLGMLAVDRS